MLEVHNAFLRTVEFDTKDVESQRAALKTVDGKSVYIKDNNLHSHYVLGVVELIPSNDKSYNFIAANMTQRKNVLFYENLEALLVPTV